MKSTNLVSLCCRVPFREEMESTLLDECSALALCELYSPSSFARIIIKTRRFKAKKSHGNCIKTINDLYSLSTNCFRYIPFKARTEWQ